MKENNPARNATKNDTLGAKNESINNYLNYILQHSAAACKYIFVLSGSFNFIIMRYNYNIKP